MNEWYGLHLFSYYFLNNNNNEEDDFGVKHDVFRRQKEYEKNIIGIK